MNCCPCNLLCIDDDGDALSSLIRALQSERVPASMHAAASAPQALKLFTELQPQVAVLDLSLDSRRGVESGFELLSKIQSLDSTCRVIVLTGHGRPEYGVRALSLGAASFLEKPADILHLKELIRDGIAQSDLRRAYNQLAQAGEQEPAGTLAGSSALMNEVRKAVKHAARTAQAVLISGETGTGKGLCAQAIHRCSSRGAKNFVKYQPGFGAADLVNSALFGHVKGAFTGAGENRAGLLLRAHGGTLFLDEIDELPLETQVVLLGALQDRKFRPVGSDEEKDSDFRLLCASNRDIDECLSQGKIREDFYHRIAHFSIHMPALRDRREDIAELGAMILARLREKEGLNVFEIDPAALRELESRDWPGNVRELEAAVEGAAFKAGFNGRGLILPEDLIKENGAAQTRAAGDFHSQVMAFKLKIIGAALRRSGGNQVKAAEELKLDRSTMRRLLTR